MGIIVKAKVKDAFGPNWLDGSKIEEQTFLVEEDRVTIWDDVADQWTNIHSLSDRVLRRIKRLASEE